MRVKHFLSILDVSTEILSRLVDDALAFARSLDAGRQPPCRLKGRAVGIYFKCPSTRTRTSFTVGAQKLGAEVIAYGPSDLQVITGETIRDTGQVLSQFLDILVIRSNGSLSEMLELSAGERMTVINAMSENEHPTQAVADLVSMKERFGALSGVHILYLGEGNNTASALAFAVALTPGMRLTLMTPEEYGLPHKILNQACLLGSGNGSIIEQRHDLRTLPRDADVVYTTRWQTMGELKPDPNWQQKFEPYRITSELMSRVSERRAATFMHDLPAVRSVEVEDDILNQPQSIVFRQAFHKMTSAMAIMSWCLNDD